MTKLVRDIMTTDPVTLGSDATAAEAARRMRDDGIGDVVVADADNVLGIVTDRDLVVRVLADGRDPEQTPLAEVASAELVSIAPDAPAWEAARLMRENAVRRLLVMDSDQLAGMVSIGDLAIEQDERSALADISAAEPNQ
jgi:CBS domain-containing protein